jgi:hypothetical protein
VRESTHVYGVRSHKVGAVRALFVCAVCVAPSQPLLPAVIHMQNEGGAAAALHMSDSTERLTSLEVEAAKRRNHLLTKVRRSVLGLERGKPRPLAKPVAWQADVGHSKPPVSGDNILTLVHGRKSVKDHTAKESAWSRLVRACVWGVFSALTPVPGQPAVMSSWTAPEGPAHPMDARFAKVRCHAPRCSRLALPASQSGFQAEVGRARVPVSADPQVAERTHGAPSRRGVRAFCPCCCPPYFFFFPPWAL